MAARGVGHDDELEPEDHPPEEPPSEPHDRRFIGVVAGRRRGRPGDPHRRARAQPVGRRAGPGRRRILRPPGAPDPCGARVHRPVRLPLHRRAPGAAVGSAPARVLAPDGRRRRRRAGQRQRDAPGRLRRRQPRHRRDRSARARDRRAQGRHDRRWGRRALPGLVAVRLAAPGGSALHAARRRHPAARLPRVEATLVGPGGRAGFRGCACGADPQRRRAPPRAGRRVRAAPAARAGRDPPIPTAGGRAAGRRRPPSRRGSCTTPRASIARS